MGRKVKNKRKNNRKVEKNRKVKDKANQKKVKGKKDKNTKSEKKSNKNKNKKRKMEKKKKTAQKQNSFETCHEKIMLYVTGIKKIATIKKQAKQFTKFVTLLTNKANKGSDYQSYFNFFNDAIARNPEIGAQDSRLKSRNSQGFRKNSDILATLGKCEQNIKTACNSSFAGGSMTEKVDRCNAIASNANTTLRGFA